MAINRANQNWPEEFGVTEVTIDGVNCPDFGFRPFICHLNDYDLFRDYAPCWDGAETNAHITAWMQRNSVQF